MIRTDTLATFVLSARLMSFTSAAQELNLTQSAVSQQIAEIERQLDVQLFLRKGRRLALTPAGHALLASAAPIVFELNNLRSRMDEFRGFDQGLIRVVATHTPGCYLLPHAIGQFSQFYPGIQTSLGVATSESLCISAERGDVDVMVTDQEPNFGRLSTWSRAKLLLDELVMIVGPKHPWSKRSVVAASELAGQPLILRQKNSKTRQSVLRCLAQAGVPRQQLSVRFEFGHSEAIVHAVMAGLGVGFISKFAAATQRNSGLLAVVAIDEVSLERPIWMLRPKRKTQSASEDKFCEHLRQLGWLPVVYREDRDSRPE
jgi:DNA-binding transcriptional LysR family regulator